MSLRARLTIFYSAVLGGVLILFGLAVYGLISVVLVRQIDSTLQRTANDLIFVIRVDENDSFTFTQRVSLDSSVIIQIWDQDIDLVAMSPTMENDSPFRQPLDEISLETNETGYRNVTIAERSYRVLSVPLSSDEMPIGILMAATSLTIVDAVQSQLVSFLLVLSAIAILVAAFLGWANARRALAPLSILTDTVLSITRADDLSRRIPLSTSPEDEVGQLIVAFNDTIGRLEELFLTQRRFVADVGHELRTPITVVRGNVDLMRKMGVEDEEALHSIELEVEHLTRLVEDLLILAQAESGKLPMDLSIIELDTLLLEVVSQSSVLAAGKVTLEIGEIDQVAVCGDRYRLKQVILNLISNAIKYSPKESKVLVGLSQGATHAQLQIRDFGSGIPADDLPHIFDRFYRGDKARTRSLNAPGFGLGLSIAYWIVRNHGGQIEAHSEAGQGSTFTVRLPLNSDDCLPDLDIAAEASAAPVDPESPPLVDKD
jgi:heavy metal sensor kinase